MGTRAPLFGRSNELEKLLTSAGDASQPCGVLGGGAETIGTASTGAGYSAEAMVDELLASTWEPVLSASGASSAPAKQAAFAQQTRAMNALQSVLADAVARLKTHRQAVTQRIAALEGENAGAGAKYQDALRSPETLLLVRLPCSDCAIVYGGRARLLRRLSFMVAQQVCSQMEDLEERFTKVSSSAVLIGDKLAKLDGERARVLETDELMEALVALNEPPVGNNGDDTKSATSSSSRLVRTLRDPAQLHEAARVIKKMGVFSSELSSPAISRAVAEIERLSQRIETDLLSEFSAAQERASLDGMRKCAASLIAYNDKDKVADRYVWNVMKDRLASLQPPAGTSSTRTDPLQDLAALFETIRVICREQFAVIEQVFPSGASSSVRELLVERLFNDPAFGIFSSLDQVLSASAAAASAQQQADAASSAAAATASPVAAAGARRTQASEEYVSLLCGAYERTCALTAAIEDIVKRSSVTIDKKKRAMQPEEDDGDEEESNNSSGGSDIEAERERMRTFLSLQLHSLFGSHRPKYFRSELELLQLTCRDVLAGVRFPQQLTARQKAAAIKAGKSAGSSGGTAASASTPTSTLASVSSTQLVSPLPSSSSLAASSTTSLDAAGGAVSLSEWSQLFFESLWAIADDAEAPNRYLCALQSAVDRCRVVLENESELRGELLTKLFSVFTAGYGDEYLGVRVLHGIAALVAALTGVA